MATTFLHSAAQGARPLGYFSDNLIQCCDVLKSRITTDANGLITTVSDASKMNHPLAVPSGGVGPKLARGSDGKLLISGQVDGRYLSSNFGRGYDNYTGVVLVNFTQRNNQYLYFWCGSPAPRYEPYPFLYADWPRNVQSFFGGGYGAYGPLLNGWSLNIFSLRAADGFNRIYSTGYGLSAINSPGFTPVEGSTIANYANFDYRCLMFYDRALVDNEILLLRDQLSAAHGLVL